MNATTLIEHGVGVELVDVVDVDGSVVDICDKQLAHAQGLLHRTVVSEVFDSDGRWLLVRQSVGRQDEGLWVSPVGGHVRAGESPLEALVRETAEELGLTGTDVVETGEYTYCRRFASGPVENHFFTAYEQRSDTIPVLNHESVEHRYFDEAEIRALLEAEPHIFGAAFHVIAMNVYAGRLWAG